MGWVTDHVFADPLKINYSMALVTFVMGVSGTALIAIGLGPFAGVSPGSPGRGMPDGAFASQPVTAVMVADTAMISATGQTIPNRCSPIKC